MFQKHSRPGSNGRDVWLTERLWELASNLSVTRVAIEQIPEFDQNCWFDARHPPTLRAIAKHARQIAAADLTRPVILSSDGRLMDGGHRLCKAWMQGETEVLAVRFEVDPPPDYTEAA